MGRKCAVVGCGNTDQKILCHRFPKNPALAWKWAENLKLENINLNQLIYKYTVCCLHFESTAYRNYLSKCLNFTALPTLTPLNPRIRKSNDVATTQASLEGDTNYSCNKAIPERQSLIRDDNETEGITSCVLEEDFESPTDLNRFDENSGYTDEMVSFSRETNAEICGIDLQDIIVDSSYEDDNDEREATGYVFEEYYECGKTLAEVIDYCGISVEEDFSPPEINTEETYKHFQDACCQTDVELEQDIESDNKYGKMTRNELIDLLETQEKLIHEQREELEQFQTAHSYLLRSVDVFTNILTGT